jgi:phage terminase large subunit-like protein
VETLEQQIERVLKLIPGYDPWAQAEAYGAWLDHGAALDAINWFAENLKHVEGSARGEPFILRPWQAAIVGNLFGWKRKDDAGRIIRRYRQSLIFIPRGNGKTPLAAGIVAYAYFEDGEPGAQCYLAAGQKEQAGTLFRNLAGMVDQEPALSSRVKIYRGDQHRSMTLNEDPLSFCKTIPADAEGQHGGIPHVTVVDELHVQKKRELLDVFETAMSKKTRAQPLLVMITTSDYERPSICNEIYKRACDVRDNGGDPSKPGMDPTFLPVIYELKPDVDWTDEKLWDEANPNLDVSVSRESLRQLVAKAKETPSLINEVRRLHFNIRTGQAVSLVPMDQWGKSRPAVEVKDLIGRACYAGLDLSSLEDLSSLGLLFPLEDEVWAVLSFSWCPMEKVQWRATRRVPYDVWSRTEILKGRPILTPTDGSRIDYRRIREDFDELAQIFQIREMAYDPHGAEQFRQDLCETYGEEFAVMMSQNHTNLSRPTKEILRRLKLGKIAHFDDPLLRWAAGNVAPYIKGRIPPGGQIADYLDKVPVMASKMQSSEKIDPFAAMVNAAARLTAHPENQAESVYESRGLLTL